MNLKKDELFNYAKINVLGPRVWEMIVDQVETSLWL